ncbi:MAG: hypothetical protein QOF12_546, partial [Solirubrobacteraceae bacterium]|nr:hypothetical protein [Solirubrobacteraceae bacterium]
MTFFAAWVGFPLLALIAAAGHGLLVERAAGVRLPGALLPPIGLAGVIVVAGLLTSAEALAPLAAPAVALVAAAGLVAGRERLADLRPAAPAAAAALGTALVQAGPALLAGGLTWPGYYSHDDTPNWLALADWTVHHGRTLDGLAPSTYEAALSLYVPTGYPVGSLLPLGLGGQALGTDLAWLYSPAMALFGAMLALALYAAAEP